MATIKSTGPKSINVPTIVEAIIKAGGDKALEFDYVKVFVKSCEDYNAKFKQIDETLASIPTEPKEERKRLEREALHDLFTAYTQTTGQWDVILWHVSKGYSLMGDPHNARENMRAETWSNDNSGDFFASAEATRRRTLPYETPDQAAVRETREKAKGIKLTPDGIE